MTEVDLNVKLKRLHYSIERGEYNAMITIHEWKTEDLLYEKGSCWNFIYYKGNGFFQWGTMRVDIEELIISIKKKIIDKIGYDNLIFKYWRDKGDFNQ